MARRSTGTTSNYGLNNTTGWVYTAGNAFSGGFHINCPDYTQVGFALMSRIAGSGDYIAIVLGQSSSGWLSLVTSAGGELTVSKINMNGLENTWQFVFWNKLGNGSFGMDLWQGPSGNISGANKIGSGVASGSWYTGSLSANRTVMFAAWSATDTIAAPLACSLERNGIWFANPLADADIIAMGNGTKKPSDLTTGLIDAYNMPQSESGNIIDSSSVPITLTVNGTIGSVAGPFDTSPATLMGAACL